METKSVTTRLNVEYYEILKKMCKEKGLNVQFVMNRYLKDGLIKDGALKDN